MQHSDRIVFEAPTDRSDIGRKALLFIAFLIAGLAIFLFGSSYFSLFPTNQSALYKAALVMFFAIASLLLARIKQFASYWRVSFAFFVAAFANWISWSLGPWLLTHLGVSDATVPGVSLAKLSEAIVVVASIVGLIVLSKQSLGSIFIQRGRWRRGLLIGTSAFALMLVIGLITAVQLGITASTLKAAAPWILLFALANGLMEELWFRGLFLNAYQPHIGSLAALVLTSLVFTATHVGATYVEQQALAGFLIIVLGLGLVWGALIQNTKSIWGSVLFHTGADVPVLIALIASLG